MKNTPGHGLDNTATYDSKTVLLFSGRMTLAKLNDQHVCRYQSIVTYTIHPPYNDNMSTVSEIL